MVWYGWQSMNDMVCIVLDDVVWIVWHGIVWGMVWYGMVWCGMVWYRGLIK